MGTSTDEGRRARKKRETAEALRTAALRLFDERGYADTTVEDIAEAVDVSSRTFNRYFPRKEDVVVPDHPERVAQLRQELADQPAAASVWHTVQEAIVGMLERDERPLEQRFLQAKLLTETAELQAFNLHRQQVWAQAIAEHAAARLGVDPVHDVRPRFIGLSAVVVLVAARQAWVADGGRSSLLDLVRHHFALLDTGWSAL